MGCLPISSWDKSSGRKENLIARVLKSITGNKSVSLSNAYKTCTKILTAANSWKHQHSEGTNCQCYFREQRHFFSRAKTPLVHFWPEMQPALLICWIRSIPDAPSDVHTCTEMEQNTHLWQDQVTTPAREASCSAITGHSHGFCAPVPWRQHCLFFWDLSDAHRLLTGAPDGKANHTAHQRWQEIATHKSKWLNHFALLTVIKAASHRGSAVTCPLIPSPTPR